MPAPQTLSGAPSLLNAAPSNVATSRGDASDSDSDADLVSHIHPDLLLQHQNQLSMQQMPNGVEEGVGAVEGGAGTMAESACLWNGCGKSFGRLDELVQHIHKEHVGTSKSTYKCMWEGCQLYSVNRTSRFALIGHIRSHTGERPFTCKLPECDKSFTRSDALTKHMRVVHGIEPLAPHAKPSGPAAGVASKKRKRGTRAEEESDDEELPQGLLESGGEDDGMDDAAGGLGTEDDTWNPHVGKGKKRASRKVKGGTLVTGIVVKTEDLSGSAPVDTRRGEAFWSDDESDYEAVYQDLDPETGTVMGTDCTPSKAKYLVAKAKYRYALGEHEKLLERLTFEIEEVKRLRDTKDEALNDLIRRQFGTAAEQLIKPIPPKGAATAANA